MARRDDPVLRHLDRLDRRLELAAQAADPSWPQEPGPDEITARHEVEQLVREEVRQALASQPDSDPPPTITGLTLPTPWGPIQARGRVAVVLCLVAVLAALAWVAGGRQLPSHPGGSHAPP